jgi:DNA ligase-1
MADNKVFDYTYFVFDIWNSSDPFHLRRANVDYRVTHDRMMKIVHVLLQNREHLDAYEAEQVALGHEGIMLADPDGKYRFGRATPKGGELLKVKRFVDAEAIVIGIEEEMFNGNAAETNELGRTKRSTAKAGLVGKGSMGALIVRDVKTGVEFNIGTGFTADERRAFWKDDYVGSTVKYKSFPVGVKDKPRHPVYLGMRPQGA